MLHATELLDSSVYDATGNYVGRVRELCIIPAEQSNRVARIVIGRGRYQTLMARHNQVASVRPGVIRLNTGELQLETYRSNESWLTMRKDLLDQQIIDIHGRKVVRVNDVALQDIAVNGHIELRLLQVDVGFAGAVRRLLSGVLSPAWIRGLEKKLPTHSIPWEFVDVIEPDALRRVKLKLPHSKLAELHPADIADIIEDLAPAERDAVMDTLDDKTAAEALEEVKDNVQVRILEELDKGRAADLLEHMAPDEAADVLADLPAETVAQVLQDMDRKEAQELVELMKFKENAAGGMMTPDVFSLRESATVREAMEALGRSPVPLEAVDAVYLTNAAGVLTGVVPVTQLLLSPPTTSLVRLRAEQLIFADTETEEKQVMDLFDKYNLRSLPVVDAEQKLVGMITVDDIVHRLWERQK